MSNSISELLQVTHDEKMKILEHYNLTEEQMIENVKIIKDWLDKNAHLPKENDEQKIMLALLNSKMSLEKTKHSLEGYYRIRRMYKDFFEKMIPNTEIYEKYKSYSKSIVMPKLTKDLCRVSLFKHADPNGEADDALLYMLHSLMIGEIRFFNDFMLSNIFIFDLEDYKFANFIKYTPSVNVKIVNILNSVNLRIQSIHVINAPPIFEKAYALAKSLLPSKIISKVIIHSSPDELKKYIQLECLPSNYGGTAPSIDELYANWLKELERSEELFQTLKDVHATGCDTEDNKAAEVEVFGMGSQGSFRKLAVD